MAVMPLLVDLDGVGLVHGVAELAAQVGRYWPANGDVGAWSCALWDFWARRAPGMLPSVSVLSGLKLQSGCARCADVVELNQSRRMRLTLAVRLAQL